MRPYLYQTIALLALVLVLVPPALGQDIGAGEEIETEKLAQTGFKFLSVSVDPRAAGMADALTALDHASSVAMFYNPAGMARLNGMFHATAGQTRWIADIGYNMASLAFSPSNGAYGVFGFSLVAVDYGEIIGTVRADNEVGYEDIDLASPTALSVGLGYAKALTDRFSVGGHVKYARQDLGSAVLSGSGGTFESEDYSLNTVAVDFGVLYKTGFRSLNFAMSARNFSRELKYVQDNFELPLAFRIGVSMDLMDFTAMNRDMHSLVLALDAERPRDFAEHLKLGGEYRFMNLLALRAGYSFPMDEQGVSLGVGLNPSFGTAALGFDYAYTAFGTFGAVHRLALQVGF